jgi:DUF1009 family protein
VDFNPQAGPAKSARGRLGIIAGSGPLPALLARAALETRGEVFILGIEGEASRDIEGFAHRRIGLGALGEAIEQLKLHDCRDICLIGSVRRPDFQKLKLDRRGATLMMKAFLYGGGDDRLLSVIVKELEGEGFAVVGAEEILEKLLAPAGLIAGPAPDDAAWRDIRRAAEVVAVLGRLDIGQGAVVCDGYVLAVEAAEGTDAMLRRCADLPGALRGREGEGRGVLVKQPKPDQELRVDMPVIGAATLKLAAQAGLAGIAVAAGRTLICERAALGAQAQSSGCFVYGFLPADLEVPKGVND